MECKLQILCRGSKKFNMQIHIRNLIQQEDILLETISNSIMKGLVGYVQML